MPWTSPPPGTSTSTIDTCGRRQSPWQVAHREKSRGWNHGFFYGSICNPTHKPGLSGLPWAKHDDQHAQKAKPHSQPVRACWLDPVNTPEPDQRHPNVNSPVGCINAASWLGVKCEQPGEEAETCRRWNKKPSRPPLLEPEIREITADDLCEGSGNKQAKGAQRIQSHQNPPRKTEHLSRAAKPHRME